MNINLINSTNVARNSNLQRNSVNLNKAKNNSVSNNVILNNSISEVIGRSQVSFRGTGSTTLNGFEYENYSSFGKSEKVEYDFTTGELIYDEVTKRDGVISRKIKFIPSTKERITIENNVDGTITTTIQNPNGTKISIDDSKKGNIYLYTQSNDGKTETVKTEHDRGRKVITKEEPGIPKKVTVIDLITDNQVTKGPLVEDWIRTSNNSKELRNIVTGAIYQSEFKLNDKTTLITYFSKKTGEKTKEVLTGSGRVETIYFNENGKPTLRELKDKNGNITTIKYSPEDCQTEIEKVKSEFDSQGREIRQTTYIPNTDTIDHIVEFVYEENKTITHYFKEQPNVREKSEIKVGKNIVQEILYRKNGKTKKSTVNHDPDGKHSIEFYRNDADSKIACKQYFDENGKPARIEYYDPATNKIAKVEYKNTDGDGFIREHKDSLTGDLLEKDYVRNIGKEDEYLYKIEKFRMGSTKPYSITTLNEDGTYTDVSYDEFGKRIGSQRLDQYLNEF